MSKGLLYDIHIHSPADYLWINKLSINDNNTYTITQDNTTTASNPSCIAVDFDGAIWYTIGAGLYRIDPITKVTTNYAVGTAYGLEIDSVGNIWSVWYNFSQSYLCKFTKANGYAKTTYAFPPNGSIDTMCIDSKDNVYSNFNGRLYIFKKSDNYAYTSTTIIVAHLIIDTDDYLWNWSNTLNKIDTSTNTIVGTYALATGMTAMYNCITDLAGNIWTCDMNNKKIACYVKTNNYTPVVYTLPEQIFVMTVDANNDITVFACSGSGVVANSYKFLANNNYNRLTIPFGTWVTSGFMSMVGTDLTGVKRMIILGDYSPLKRRPRTI